MASQSRGRVFIRVEECKGCGLCVESCPPTCLELAPELSSYGVHPARYLESGCTGCEFPWRWLVGHRLRSRYLRPKSGRIRGLEVAT